jgi:hypothetical protein
MALEAARLSAAGTAAWVAADKAKEIVNKSPVAAQGKAARPAGED